MSNVPQQPVPPPAQRPPPAGPAGPDLTMAWLPHLLALFTCFIGPMIIWLVKKDQDKLAAFHGKQAMFWVIGVYAIIILLWVLTFLLAFVVPPLVFLGICAVWVPALGNLAYVIYAIVMTAQGKPFKYFFIADQFCKKEFAEAYPGQA